MVTELTITCTVLHMLKSVIVMSYNYTFEKVNKIHNIFFNIHPLTILSLQDIQKYQHS